MSYFYYVLSAYGVYAVFMLWDFAVPRWNLARVQRSILQRAKREAARRIGDSTP